MNDARRYRGNAVDCLLTAKACSDYRNILVSIAATWHALARQDEAMDMLLESWSAPSVRPNLNPSRAMELNLNDHSPLRQ